MLVDLAREKARHDLEIAVRKVLFIRSVLKANPRHGVLGCPNLSWTIVKKFQLLLDFSFCGRKSAILDSVGGNCVLIDCLVTKIVLRGVKITGVEWRKNWRKFFQCRSGFFSSVGKTFARSFTSGGGFVLDTRKVMDRLNSNLNVMKRKF